jgi:hypothetical protein
VQLYRYFVSRSGEFFAITLCVTSQRVFIVVSIYFFMTQSRNFWIHPHIYLQKRRFKTIWSQRSSEISDFLLSTLLYADGSFRVLWRLIYRQCFNCQYQREKLTFSIRVRHLYIWQFCRRLWIKEAMVWCDSCYFCRCLFSLVKLILFSLEKLRCFPNTFSMNCSKLHLQYLWIQTYILYRILRLAWTNLIVFTQASYNYSKIHSSLQVCQ